MSDTDPDALPRIGEVKLLNDDIRKEILARLHKTIALVESGEVNGMFIVVTKRDNSWVSSCNGETRYTLIGAVHAALHSRTEQALKED